MYAIQPLLSLVASMTKSEKRYFRLVAGLQQGAAEVIRDKIYASWLGQMVWDGKVCSAEISVGRKNHER